MLKKSEPQNKFKKKFLIIFAISLILISAVIMGCSKKSDDLGGENMKNPVVVLETSKGIIEVELNKDKAPISTENFLTYVKEGHYDGTIFHRIIPNFMVQGGGFLPNGTQKSTHDPIKLESKNGLKNTKYTIAMARTMVPDSATSQFFINTVNNDFLDYRPGNDGYAVFGKVISGMDVVDNMSSVKTGRKGPNQDWPIEDIVIIKAYVKP